MRTNSTAVNTRPVAKRVATSLEDQFAVPYFETQEPADKQLNVRITQSVRERLDFLVEVWSAMAKAKHPKAPDVTIGDVVGRLLRLGLDGAFAELGGYPANPEDKERFIAAAIKRIRSSDK